MDNIAFRKGRIAFSLILAATIVASITRTSTVPSSAAAPHHAGSLLSPATVSGTPILYPPGVPAIQPVMTGVATSTIAFGETEVRQFLSAHPPFLTPSGTLPAIT